MPRKRRLAVKASSVAMGHKQKFDKALPVSTLELRGLDLREYEGPWRLAKSARAGPPNRWGDWVERLGKRISLAGPLLGDFCNNIGPIATNDALTANVAFGALRTWTDFHRATICSA